jgi:hypothetical protein
MCGAILARTLDLKRISVFGRMRAWTESSIMGSSGGDEELGVVVPATVPETLFQEGRSGLDVEETLRREGLDEEELGVQTPRAGVRVLPEEIEEDLYPPG